MSTDTRFSKFELGTLLATAGAVNAIPSDDILVGVARHANGDWGDVGTEDWERNDEALKSGDRLLSAYVAPNGTRFWIITECDRSATTVLLPDEY